MCAGLWCGIGTAVQMSHSGPIVHTVMSALMTQVCCALCELLVSWNQSLKKEYIVNHYLAGRIVLWHLKQQCEVSNATMANAGRKNKLLQCFTWGPDPYPEGSGLLFLCFNICPSAGRNWKNWIKTCGYLDFASLFDWTSTDWAMSTCVCSKQDI